MKVCVTALNPGINAQVDPRFGRAQYFVFVDMDTMKCESVPNPNVNAYGGVGIQSAQLVAERGAKVVITGHIGPNASQALAAAGIKVITGMDGLTVREAVERFKRGEVNAVSPSATAPAHSGMEVPASKEDIRKEIEQLKVRIAQLERKLEEMK